MVMYLVIPRTSINNTIDTMPNNKLINTTTQLKEWTGAKQFPTQQNICDRGDQLIESIEIV